MNKNCFFKLFFGFLFAAFSGIFSGVCGRGGFSPIYAILSYYFVAGLAVFPAYADGEESSPRMCYFQLTSASEKSGDEALSLQQTFNLDGSAGALISYFGSENDNRTQAAFEKMVEEGKKCDALVLSGHHTGDFYPDNKKRGSLVLKTIERLSCDPKYKNWFNNVQAIYLHGSRTVNDKYITSVKSNPNSVSRKGDSESVKDKLVGDKGVTLEASDTVETVNYSYAHTLDEHNPLSSRYMRSFPSAHIFGFSEEAGLGKGDEDIANHIAKVLNALSVGGKIKSDFKNAEKFAEALAIITADECDGRKWEGDGKEFVQNTRDNKNKEARELGCELIQAKQILSDENKNGEHEKAKVNIKTALTKIAEDKELSHRLINNVTETLQFAKKKEIKGSVPGKSFLEELKDILQTENSQFKSALQEKINSPILPSLRKTDYIQLYKELQGNDNKINQAVQALVTKVTGASIPTTTDNKKTLYILMADKLSQYGLLKQPQIDDIMKNGGLFPERNATQWQKDMKERLTYRSYADEKEEDHDFIKSLDEKDFSNESNENPNYIFVVTQEILKRKDLNTAFLVAEKLAPENYTLQLQEPNEKFMFTLERHINDVPVEKRQEIFEEYFQAGKVSDDNIKEGKINFQANLLRVLFRMNDVEFNTSFEKNKEKFFNELETNSNLNTELGYLLSGLINKINESE